jgi:flavin reductase (DIM6/NTAB) family NADH-FMN oxidoreductase RutF
VVLVSVGDGEVDNLFPVSWNMPVRSDPPMVAILSGKDHHSYPIIARTGEFGLNVPDESIVDAVLGCGSTTGAEVRDKLTRFGLTRRAAARIAAPLVEEAVAGLECRVCQVVDLGDSSLLVAQVVAAAASPAHFVDGAYCFDNGLRLIHHLGGARFCVSDRSVEGREP